MLAGGCGQPECSLNATVSGAIMGPAAFDSSGENLCSTERLSGLVIIDFYQDLNASSAGVTNIQVNVMSAELVEGTFPATVVVSDIQRSFSADGSVCSITISNLAVEDWTVTDYVNFTGDISCTESLTPISGGLSTVELGPTQITGHVLYE